MIFNTTILNVLFPVFFIDHVYVGVTSTFYSGFNFFIDLLESKRKSFIIFLDDGIVSRDQKNYILD